jgi:hypothetical protein
MISGISILATERLSGGQLSGFCQAFKIEMRWQPNYSKRSELTLTTVLELLPKCLDDGNASGFFGANFKKLW